MRKSLSKALGILLVILMVFTFAACSDDDSGTTGTTGTVVDTTAPTFTAGPAATASSTTASVSVTVSEIAAVFWVCQPSGDAAPDAAALKSGNSNAAAAATPVVLSVTGLSTNTEYTIYVMAVDLASNESAIASDTFTTTGDSGDTTAPAWTVDPVVSGSPTQTEAYVAYTIDEACTVYYAVLPDGTPTPDAAAIKAFNTNRLYSTAGVSDQVFLQNLTAGTAYDVFFVAVDGAGNDSDVKKVDVLTESSGSTFVPAFSNSDMESDFTFAYEHANVTLAFVSTDAKTGSRSLSFAGTASSNGDVMKVTPALNDPTGYQYISFWIKGSATTKSLVIEIPDGGTTRYFSLGDASAGVTVSRSGSASYGSGFDTAGSWVKVRLDISTGDAITTGVDQFLIRWGSGGTYALLIDDIGYEN